MSWRSCRNRKGNKETGKQAHGLFTCFLFKSNLYISCLLIHKQRKQILWQALCRILEFDLRALDRGLKGVLEVGSALGGVEVHPAVGIPRQDGHDPWFQYRDKTKQFQRIDFA